MPAAVGCIKFRPPITAYDNDEEQKNKFSGKSLLSVSSDGVVAHWNATSGKLQHQLRHEDQALYACDFAPDGLHFTVAGSDSKIYLYDEVTK